LIEGRYFGPVFLFPDLPGATGQPAGSLRIASLSCTQRTIHGRQRQDGQEQSARIRKFNPLAMVRQGRIDVGRGAV
jgi:hypothetical protein